MIAPSNPLADSLTYLSFPVIDLFPGDEADVVTVYSGMLFRFRQYYVSHPPSGTTTASPTLMQVAGRRASGLELTLTSIPVLVTFESNSDYGTSGFTASYITTPYPLQCK